MVTTRRCDDLTGLTRRWQRARGVSRRPARRAACVLEMDDELTGEPSEVGFDGEGLSVLALGDEHDATMGDMGAEEEALARDAEREQQRDVLV